MINLENDMLNVIIEKPLVENYSCNKCKDYKNEIKFQIKFYKVLN